MGPSSSAPDRTADPGPADAEDLGDGFFLLLRLAQRHPEEPDHARVLARLLRYVAGEARSLDEAFGLAARPGAPGARQLLRRDRRNDALRRLAALACPDATPHAAAKALLAAIDRFRRREWPAIRDGARAADPADEPRALMLLLVREGHRIPAPRQLRSILARTGSRSGCGNSTPLPISNGPGVRSRHEHDDDGPATA